MKSTLRIGLIGGGAVAQMAHLPALARARHVRLTAICEGADDLLRAIGQRAGVAELYQDHREFLARAPIDAVLLAVPDAFHVPLAIDALRAGKHVLVEKPLGTHSAECLELLRVVRQTGLRLQVGSMKRHDPGVAFARQFVQEKLGPILSVSGLYRDTIFRQAMQETCLDPLLTSRQAVKPATDPKGNKERYNLITQGAHLFDCLRHLGGEIVAVTTQVARHAGQCSWHGLLEFEHGGRGHFELTCKACGDWFENYTVCGESGSVDVRVSLPFYHRPAQVRAFDGKTQQWSQPLGGRSNAYANQLEAFARSVLHNEPTNPDVAEGLATVRLLEAVESALARGARAEVVRD